MITPHLVLGTAICGPQVDALELRGIWHQTEGDADKSPRLRGGAGAGLTGEVDLDNAVLELGARENDQSVFTSFATLLYGVRNAKSLATLEGRGLSFHFVRFEIVQRVERKGFCLGLREGERRAGQENQDRQ